MVSKIVDFNKEEKKRVYNWHKGMAKTRMGFSLMSYKKKKKRGK